jgi:hypothetical protein
VIPRYLDLFDHLGAVRRGGAERAPPRPGREPVPLRPDPARAFADYPSAALTPEMRFVLAPGSGLEALRARARVPGVVGRGSLLPSEKQLAAMLARLAAGPATAADLVGLVPAGRGARGLVWLLKFDLVRRID